MPNVEVRALRSFKYSTRRLEAGDVVEMPAAHAKLYTTLPKDNPYATKDRGPVKLAPAPAAVVDKAKEATVHVASGGSARTTAAQVAKAMEAEQKKAAPKPVGAMTTKAAKKPVRRKAAAKKK